MKGLKKVVDLGFLKEVLNVKIKFFWSVSFFVFMVDIWKVFDGEEL